MFHFPRGTSVLCIVYWPEFLWLSFFSTGNSRHPDQWSLLSLFCTIDLCFYLYLLLSFSWVRSPRLKKHHATDLLWRTEGSFTGNSSFCGFPRHLFLFSEIHDLWWAWTKRPQSVRQLSVFFMMFVTLISCCEQFLRSLSGTILMNTGHVVRV